MEFSKRQSSLEEKMYADLIALLKDFLECMKANQAKADSPYYDNADLKEILHVSDSSLFRMRKTNKVPFEKIMGKIYYRKSFFTKTFKP